MWKWVAGKIDRHLNRYELEKQGAINAAVSSYKTCQKCGMLYVSGQMEGDKPPDPTPTQIWSDGLSGFIYTVDGSFMSSRYQSSDRHCPRCYGEAAEVVRLQAWARDNASAAKECRDKCAGRPVRKVVKCKKRGK